MENRKLIGGSVLVSIVGVGTLFALSLYMEPSEVSSRYGEYVGRYVVLRGVVIDVHGKYFTVDSVEVFWQGDVSIGDYTITEGVLKKTPGKYVKRGFPPYQIYPEECEVYRLHERFFGCYVEGSRIGTLFGAFTVTAPIDFNGVGGLIGEVEGSKIMIRDVFPLEYDHLLGTVEEKKGSYYIEGRELVVSGLTLRYGEKVEAYGFSISDKEFLCLYCESKGISIERIDALRLDEVMTVRGTVISRRYYYDGDLIEIEDETGKVKAFVQHGAYEGYTVEVSGLYKEYRNEEMLVGEVRVLSDDVFVHDLSGSVSEERFWGRGVVEKVENVRGHLYLYIGEYKISVYAGDARKFWEHGIDLFHSEGRELVVLLESGEDTVLLDVMA